jgi:hypothetical protein
MNMYIVTEDYTDEWSAQKADTRQDAALQHADHIGYDISDYPAGTIFVVYGVLSPSEFEIVATVTLEEK